ncbi:MAG: superoxide dismutase [Thermoleophilia bacterium]|nr:superoxide dismutase [Thermoleophilia bacterium]
MRTHLVFTLTAALAAVVAFTAPAAPAKRQQLPQTIQLPAGFQPEGIAIRGSTFYVGSIPTGAVYRGSLVTGQGAVLPGTGGPGRAATGLEVAGKLLFVSGAATGQAFVYDARTGAALATYQLATTSDTFINDVVVAHGAAYFTDSRQPVLYRIPLRGKKLPPQDAVQRLPLTGDITYESGFNANGIDATPNGKTLVIVQSNTGLLFTVDPKTGLTRGIALTGGLVRNGDGILLDGRRLYVVQNRDNQIAVVELTRGLRSGTIARHIASPAFDVPTTIDEFGKWLYAVNARFGTAPTAGTPYSVVRVAKH